MSLSASTRMAVLFMFLGSVLTVAVLGVGWVVYHQMTAATTDIAAATAAPVSAVTTDPRAADAPPPVKRPRRPAPVVQVEPVPEAPKVEAPVAEDPAAKAAAEAAAKAAADEAKEKAFQAEVAYMGQKFDQHKDQFMNVIDTYLALPADQRVDYVRKAFEELQQTIQAEREADGMPPRPADQRRVGQQMLRLAGERLNDDEKKKVATFMGDMMQRQMARAQADMQQQLKVPPADAPAPNQ